MEAVVVAAAVVALATPARRGNSTETMPVLSPTSPCVNEETIGM